MLALSACRDGAAEADPGDPLRNETKIAPHQAASGTVVFGFPITKTAFDARQELKIVIVPYDQREVAINEKK